MNAKKLNCKDWELIFSSIETGFSQGEIHSTQGDEVIHGHWILTEKGISIIFINFN